MDGRAQLQSLAQAIGGASAVDAAWAGTGPSVDLRKQCGICGEDQPIRVPFLRHVCRKCSAIWVPGICVDCAHTSVTFTMDGQLSPLARCGCQGTLRQVAYVPAPRKAVDPEIAAARKELVVQRQRRAAWTTRGFLLVVAAVAAWGGLSLVHRNHSGPPPAAVPTHAPSDSDALTPEARGRLAADRLLANGEPHDVFGCATQLPPDTRRSAEGADSLSQRFIQACLKG